MEEFFGVILLVVVLILAVIGVFHLSNGSMDYNVVAMCKERGYWQTGQTRVICSVEGGK